MSRWRAHRPGLHRYLAVGDRALRGVFERPTVLERLPDGALGDPNFCETVPQKRPEWLETVLVTFPKTKGEPERVAPSRARRETS